MNHKSFWMKHLIFTEALKTLAMLRTYEGWAQPPQHSFSHAGISHVFQFHHPERGGSGGSGGSRGSGGSGGSGGTGLRPGDVWIFRRSDVGIFQGSDENDTILFPGLTLTSDMSRVKMIAWLKSLLTAVHWLADCEQVHFSLCSKYLGSLKTFYSFL